MLVHLDQSVTRSAHGLLVDTDTKKISWQDITPYNAWLCMDNICEHSKCYQTLLKLNKKTIDIAVPAKYLNILSSINLTKNDILLSQFMKKTDYKSYLKKLVDQIINLSDGIEYDYYDNVFNKTTLIFNSLEQANIDIQLLYQYLEAETNTAQYEYLLSFNEPNIIYDRFKSKTGRLIVESGPKILLLKKEYRNIIKSRYGDSGTILYFDYSALETRIMLQIAGIKTSDLDIYASLSSIIFNNKLSRDATKKIILAIAYGMSITTIAHELNISHKEASGYYDDVCNYLNKSKLESMAYENFSNGILSNYYGRKIIGDNNILNSYIQSTGVDVALFGFSNMAAAIQSNKFLMHPLFILHDALIVDCHNSFLPFAQEIINAACTVPGFNCTFPIHVEQIK